MSAEEAVARAVKHTNTRLDNAIQLLDMDETNVLNASVGRHNISFLVERNGKRYNVEIEEA